MKDILTAAMLLAVLLIEACAEAAAPPCTVAAVVVSPGTASVERDLTVQLTAIASATNCATVPATTWTSSQPGIATVSASGLLTGVAVGTTTVTASAMGITGTGTVTVTQPPPATSTVTPATASFVSLGATSQLAAEAKDARGVVVPGLTFTWASSNAAVATVSATGLVTAVANGTASITATTGTIVATANMTVGQVAAAISITPATASFNALGATSALTAVVTDGGGSAMSVAPTWSSSAAGVATVTSTGLVTAVANGTTTITATFGSLSATAAMTVAQVATSIDVTPPNITIASLGATTTLTAVVRDSRGNAMTATPVWTTSNAGTVTVSAAGVATAVTNGFSNVTATFAGFSDVTVVNVVQAVADMVFTVQPPNGTASATLAPNIKVSLRDARGNVATNSNATVTLFISTNPLGGAIGGTFIRAAVSGVADFTGISIDKRGTGYKLTASAPGFSVVSAAFNIDRSAADANLKLTSLQIHDQGGTCIDLCTAPSATVTAGSNVVGKIVGTLWNQAACPTCITQMVTGFGVFASVCYSGGVPGLYPGTAISTDGNIPSPTPLSTGTVMMRVKLTQQLACNAAALTEYSAAPPPAEEGIGYIVTTNTTDYTTALTNIKFNGKVLQAVVSSGQPVTLTLNYQVWNATACPNCVNQVVVGINATAADCAYDGIPGLSPGVTGSKTMTLTAPTTPGTYEVRYKTILDFTCTAAKAGYNASPPGTHNAIGTIVVIP